MFSTQIEGVLTSISDTAWKTILMDNGLRKASWFLFCIFLRAIGWRRRSRMGIAGFIVPLRGVVPLRALV